MVNRGKGIAEQHTGWFLSIIGKIYKEAMEHGYGHGYEDGLEDGKQ